MHYKNGREAKNGDKVVMIDNGNPVCGILHSATAGNDSYNGSIRQVAGGDHYANLSQCLHIDDIAKAVIPDSTQEPAPIPA